MHRSQDTNSKSRHVHCADWIAPKTRESNKNQRERSQDEDHSPFRVHILQLRVLEKVSSVFTGGGWSWIYSKSNWCGESRRRGESSWPGSDPRCVGASLYISLVIFSFILFSVCLPSQLLTRALLKMHTDACARSHKRRPSAARSISGVIIPDAASSRCGHLCQIS